MTRQEFRALLTPFVMAFRAEFDTPTWTGYYRVLGDVPLAQLEAALDALSRQDHRFVPTAPQILAAAEACRQALLAAHPYQPGECCNFSGWRDVEDGDVIWVVRCRCYQAHQQELIELGIVKPLTEPRQLESGAFDPRMAQMGERE